MVMPSDAEHRRTLLDAARAEPSRRERRRLLVAACGYAAVGVLSGLEMYFQVLSRRVVDDPENVLVLAVFGLLALVCLVLAAQRLRVARSLGRFPGWSAEALARLPPKIARLAGLPPAETRRSRGFALGGGVFTGGDGASARGATEITTPEVLRSTSLRSRTSVRKTTPQQEGGLTPARTGTSAVKGSERRLFSPDDSATGRKAHLTPLERAKAGRRALAVQPEDVDALMKDYDKRHAAPNPVETPTVQPQSLAFLAQGQGFQHGGMRAQGRGYYGQGAGESSGWGSGGASLTYQAYEPGETKVASGRKERESDRDKAEALLVRFGIAEKTDEVTKNVKTYVVRLMRQYLHNLDEVCSLLHERGVKEELLRLQVHRQPQLRLRNTPRAFVNLSFKDMAIQFGNNPDFWVEGPDGQRFSLFQKYQHLEEALNVTAGSGFAGVGNPAYVLERLRVLAEDDFMSAFVYNSGGGYPSNKEWSPDLPTDAAVVMRLFVSCGDDLLQRQWDQDRPFARQHYVDRQPSNSDALPGRVFLTRNDSLHPPHFFVVADQEVWQALPGPTNAFQAIALFLYYIDTHKSGYLGTGVSIAKIIQEIFGGGSDASSRVFYA